MTNKEVVYPSVSSFSGTAQLNMGPFASGDVNTLFRAEVRGKTNYQGVTIASTGVEANFQVWGLQWVESGNSPADVVTSLDDDHWLIREQLGTLDTRMMYSPSSNTAAYFATNATKAEWAGQLVINLPIDLYISFRAPTGASITNMNYFGTIRWWWS